MKGLNTTLMFAVCIAASALHRQFHFGIVAQIGLVFCAAIAFLTFVYHSSIPDAPKQMTFVNGNPPSEDD